MCYKNADELEKKDLDELYKYLREHIEEWWDQVFKNSNIVSKSSIGFNLK